MKLMYFMLGTPHLSRRCGRPGNMSEARGDGVQESQWQGMALVLDILYAEKTYEGDLSHDKSGRVGASFLIVAWTCFSFSHNIG